MRAAAIDRFGGPEVLEVRSLPVPVTGAREVRFAAGSARVHPQQAR